MARLPAVHRVEHQGAVVLDTQGGARLAAVLGIGPAGGVGDGAVAHHDIPHAAGPLGLGQGGVGAAGGQGDGVAHLKGGKGVPPVGGVGSGKDVLVRSNGDGLVGNEQLGHLQGDAAVDGEVGDPAGKGVGRCPHTHIPAAAVAAGGDGGEVLIEQVDATDLVAGLVEVVGDH